MWPQLSAIVSCKFHQVPLQAHKTRLPLPLIYIACSWTRTKKSFAEMTGPKRGPIPRPTSRYQKQLVWFYERCTIHIILHISCVHVYILILCITVHITHTYMLINSHHEWHMTKDDQRTWKSQHSQVVGSSLVLPCHLKMLVSTRLYLGPTSQVRSLLPGCLIKIASETFTIPKKRLSSKHSFSRGYVKLRGY